MIIENIRYKKVIELALQEQVKQGNKKDSSKVLHNDVFEGNFNWRQSTQKYNFWSLINDQEYVEAKKIFNWDKEEKMEQTTTLKIEIPEGFEIDKMDVNTGVVSFKKITEKYPLALEYLPRGNKFYINSDSTISITSKDSREFSNSVDKNLCDTKEETKAFLALIQLRRFANAWNEIDNFKPTPIGDSKQNKFSIINSGGNLTVVVYSSTNCILSFKKRGTVDKFKETFSSLLEEAKILL